MKNYEKILTVIQFILTLISICCQALNFISFLTSISIVTVLPFINALIVRYVERKDEDSERRIRSVEDLINGKT